MIIIGSTALRYHGVPFREPKDKDIFVTLEELVVVHKNLDIQYVSEEIISLIPNTCGVATPDAVYTIKLSHLPWNVHSVHGVWEKHYRDVQYLKKIGCRIIKPLYEALSYHWTQKNGNKDFLNMEQSKEEFFTDFVEYKYEHDYLHELLVYPDIPIYNKCVKDGQEVDVDQEKFNQLSFQHQVDFFRQEIGVIAVERWLVHKPIPLVTAWTLAVKKTITTLTKEWMSEFIVRHIEHFVTPNRDDFTYIFNTLHLKENDMQKLTNKQVEQLKEEMTLFLVDWKDEPIAPEDVDDSNFHEMLLGGEVINSPDFEFIEQDGGYEGGAEHCETVFKWKDTYYKVVFSYASYEGFNFDYTQWYVVTPVSKQVTVYE